MARRGSWIYQRNSCLVLARLASPTWARRSITKGESPTGMVKGSQWKERSLTEEGRGARAAGVLGRREKTLVRGSTNRRRVQRETIASQDRDEAFSYRGRFLSLCSGALGSSPPTYATGSRFFKSRVNVSAYNFSESRSRLYIMLIVDQLDMVSDRSTFSSRIYLVPCFRCTWKVN